MTSVNVSTTSLTTTTLTIITSAGPSSLMQAAAQQYALLNPNIQINIPVTINTAASSGSSQGLAELAAGQGDALFAQINPTAATMKEYPDIIHLQAAGIPFAAAYNVPIIGQQLVLNQPVLCKIFRGGITKSASTPSVAALGLEWSCVLTFHRASCV